MVELACKRRKVQGEARRMSTYKEKKYNGGTIPEPGLSLRTNYRCAARGCPNAGSIDDGGEDHPGRCFFHWRADPKDWPAVTQRIIENFEAKRNWR